MIISLRQVSKFIRMLVFVGLFSFICFKVLTIVQGLIEPAAHKYKEPVGGDAMKVSAVSAQVARTSDQELLWEEMLARLGVFYRLGE